MCILLKICVLLIIVQWTISEQQCLSLNRNVNKCEDWKNMSVLVANLVGRSTVDDIKKIKTTSNMLTLLIRAASGVIGRGANTLKNLVVNGLVLLMQTILKVSEYETASNKSKFVPSGHPIDWILNNSYIKSMMGDAVDETLSDRLDRLALGMPCVQLLMCRLSPVVHSMQRRLKEDWLQRGPHERAAWNVSDWLQVRGTAKHCAEKHYDCAKLVNPNIYSDRD